MKDRLSMAQIFGDFLEDLPSSQEYLVLGFSPSSVPLQKRWRNNGLSADFIADYLTTFFPVKDIDSPHGKRNAEIRSAVNYIANELLENAMKFSDDSTPVGISLQLQLHADRLIFLAINTIKPFEIKRFQTTIDDLVSQDPNDLFVQRVEANTSDSKSSGLGLITMMNDYLTRIGWKFETLPSSPETVTVTTMVQLFI
jgi:hypothetical protein